MDCLAMHAGIEDVADQLLAGDWISSADRAEQVLANLQSLRVELTAHIAMMEGPAGLTECLSDHCPRLTRRISDMCREHAFLRTALAEVESLLDCYRRGIGDPAKILALVRHLQTAARDHQDASNSLLLEAYHNDLGAGD